MNPDALKISMTSLVKVLRELLANMEEEQHALLIQDAGAFQMIMNRRAPLISSMQTCRHTMISEIDDMVKKHSVLIVTDSEHEKLVNLAQLAGEDNVELLTLRDQVLALMEKMEKQNLSNNSLLGNRVTDTNVEKENYSHQYKPVKRRIPPKKNPVQQKKTALATLEVVEGQ